jgi:hypothetical protein
MRWSILVMCVTVGSLVAADAPEKSKGVIPQTRPVVALLKAVKAGDTEQMKDAYSEKFQKQIEKLGGWDKNLKYYGRAFKAFFGDYQLDEFTFGYSGGDDAGKVSITHKGKKVPGMKVVKEKGGWKINQR